MPALLVWLLLAAGADRPINTELVASNVAVIQEPDGYPAVEFDLTNGTGKSVTAWVVWFRLEFADGTVETVGQGIDDYATCAGARQVTRFDPENVHVVPPHASIRTGYFETDRHGGLARATVLRVEYAIFDDGSWIGHERSALDTFKRRGRTPSPTPSSSPRSRPRTRSSPTRTPLPTPSRVSTIRLSRTSPPRANRSCAEPSADQTAGSRNRRRACRSGSTAAAVVSAAEQAMVPR